jgi:YNFM family putative membrane transporter
MGDYSYTESREGAASHAKASALVSGVGVTLLGLYVAAFLVSLDRAVFAPLIPALSQDFHETVGAVGLAVSAYTLPYGLFQLGYGPLGDRTGKLTVIRWTFLVFAFGTGLCGLAITLPMLDLLRAVTGACAAAIIPLALAHIGDVVPYEQRQQTITNLMGATSFGNALSAAVGGAIGQFLSWRALFGLYGICALLIAVALFRTSTGRPIPTAATAPRADRQYGELLRLRKAQLLFLIVGLEGVFVYGGFTYLGAYLSDRFALDYLTIGMILACYGTGTVLTSRFVRYFLRRLGEANLILLGGLLLATGFLVLLPLGWWQIHVAPMLWMGAGFALFHSTLQTRATELIPALRGTSVAMFAFSLFLGGGIGTAMFGWLITAYGYAPLLVASGGGMLCVTAVARRVW